MKTSIGLIIASALFLGGLLALSVPPAAGLAAQEKEKAEKKEKRKKAKAAEKKAEPAPGHAPASPQAGPEHALLKQFEGNWDAKVTVHSPAGDETQPGTETYTLACGGLWLVGDFKGTEGLTGFEGHSVMGYDTKKKKYIGTWVDSMQTFVVLSEGTFDDKGKVLTMHLEAPDMTGRVTKQKHVSEFKDKDARTFSMHIQGPDGNYFKLMTIEYTRKK